MSTRLLHDRAQLLRFVTPEHEADLDVLVAVADLVRQSEDAQQVDVTLDSRGDLREGDAAGCGDVGDACGEAGGEGVQYVLDRRRAVVRPDQHGRVVGVEREWLPVGHFLLGAVEAVERRPVVGPADPAVGGPELELGDVGVAFHGVECGEQGCGVDAVPDGVLGDGH